MNKPEAVPIASHVTSAGYQPQLEVQQIAQMLVQQALDLPRQRQSQQTSTSKAVQQQSAARQAATQRRPEEANSLLAILQSLLVRTNSHNASNCFKCIERTPDATGFLQASAVLNKEVPRLPGMPQSLPPAVPQSIPPQVPQNAPCAVLPAVPPTPVQAVPQTAPDKLLPAGLFKLPKPVERAQSTAAAAATTGASNPAGVLGSARSEAAATTSSAAAAVQPTPAGSGSSHAAALQTLLAGFDSDSAAASAAAGPAKSTPAPSASAAAAAAVTPTVPAVPAPVQAQLSVVERLGKLLVQMYKQRQEQQQLLLEQQQQQQQECAMPTSATHSAGVLVGSKRSAAEVLGQQELLMPQAKQLKVDASATAAASATASALAVGADLGGVAGEKNIHETAATGVAAASPTAIAAGERDDLEIAGDIKIPVAAAAAAYKPPILPLPRGMQMSFLRASGFFPLSRQQPQGQPDQVAHWGGAGGTDISSTQQGGSTNGSTVNRDPTNGRFAKARKRVGRPPGAKTRKEPAAKKNVSSRLPPKRPKSAGMLAQSNNSHSKEESALLPSKPGMLAQFINSEGKLDSVWLPLKAPKPAGKAAQVPGSGVMKDSPQLPKKGRKPGAVAQFAGSDGKMVGWEDRTYSTGTDRDRIWQEHKLVMRCLEIAVASQPAILAKVRHATFIFKARSCIVCWKNRPISGAWCCTRPSCYKVGTAAAQAAAVAPGVEKALLRHNWAIVRKTVLAVVEEAGSAAAAAAAGVRAGDHPAAALAIPAEAAGEYDATAAAAAAAAPAAGVSPTSSSGVRTTSGDRMPAAAPLTTAAAVAADCSHAADTEMSDAAAPSSADLPVPATAAAAGNMDANLVLSTGIQVTAAPASATAGAHPADVASGAGGSGPYGGTATSAELAVTADAALQGDMPAAAGSNPAAATAVTEDAPGSAAVLAPVEAGAAVGPGSPSNAGHASSNPSAAAASAAAVNSAATLDAAAAAAADDIASPCTDAAAAAGPVSGGSSGASQGPPMPKAAAAASAPDPNWVLPSKEYKYPDTKRLWEEHQLQLKVLLLELEDQPEALATAQQTISRVFHRCCIRCFSEGEGKSRVSNGSWLCATCVRMFGSACSITDQAGLYALAHRISVDPRYNRHHSKPWP